MRMVLVISAQPATSNEERQAVLFSCFRDGSLLMEAKDGKKPLGLFRNILYRGCKSLTDGAFAVIVMNFYSAQYMGIND